MSGEYLAVELQETRWQELRDGLLKLLVRLDTPKPGLTNERRELTVLANESVDSNDQLEANIPEEDSLEKLELVLGLCRSPSSC